jgi:hypothetical protein
MPLSILDIEGENHQFIKDPKAERILDYIGSGMVFKKFGCGYFPDSIAEPRKRLGEVVGYRKTQRLKPDELIEFAREEKERRKGINQFWDGFVNKCVKAAKSKVKINYPDFDSDYEIRLDACFNALTRTEILTMLKYIEGNELDAYETSEKILRGELNLSELFSEDLIELSILAMLDHISRNRLFNHLRTKYRLGENEIEEIDKALYYSEPKKLYELLEKIHIPEKARPEICKALLSKEWKRELEGLKKHGLKDEDIENLIQELERNYRGISSSQPFRLGRALRKLYNQKNDVREVLSSGYFQETYYPLAREVSNLICGWLSGNNGIPSPLLAYLCELTGMDAREYITKWGSGTSDIYLLHPTSEINDKTLGAIWGALTSRGMEFLLRQCEEEYLLDLIESIGSLSRKPRIQQRWMSSKSFKKLDLNPKKDSYECSPRMNMPMQLVKICMAIEKYWDKFKNSEFTISALKNYLMHRKWEDCEFSIGSKEEPKIREFAQLIGINISNGYKEGDRKICYIKREDQRKIGLI